MRRIASVTSKEFIHIVRDARTCFLVFISPAFVLVMLSYLFTIDVDRFSLAVFDQDKSSLSRQYMAALTQDGSMDLRYDVTSEEEVDQLLLLGRVRGVLVVPPGFMTRVSNGEAAHVQVILDGANPSIARQMLAQLGGRTEEFLAQLSAAPEEVEELLVPIDVRTRVWYNPSARAANSMVPGLIAVVMCMPAFSIATSLTREKEMGTMEGLMATPIRGFEFLAGKLLAYVACGLASVVLVFLVATLWFRVPFQGNFGVFMVLTADFLLAVLGLSMLLCSFLSSQQAAMVVLFLVFFIPSIFLSGLIDPIDRTSLSAQLESYVLPTTYYITVSRGVFLKGVGWSALWPPALAMGALGTAGLSAAIVLFRRKLK